MADAIPCIEIPAEYCLSIIAKTIRKIDKDGNSMIINRDEYYGVDITEFFKSMSDDDNIDYLHFEVNDFIMDDDNEIKDRTFHFLRNSNSEYSDNSFCEFMFMSDPYVISFEDKTTYLCLNYERCLKRNIIGLVPDKYYPYNENTHMTSISIKGIIDAYYIVRRLQEDGVLPEKGINVNELQLILPDFG